MSKKYITDKLEISGLNLNSQSTSVLVQDEVFGPEEVVNGDFSNGLTGWSGSDMTVSNEQLIKGGNSLNYQGGVIEDNKTYKITVDIPTLGAGLRVYVGGTQVNLSQGLNALTVSSGNANDFVGFNTGLGSVINSISVLEVISGTNDIQKRVLGSNAFTNSSDDINLNDNVKANFGDANDLQIYHDGSNGNISNNTGGLLINTDIFRVLNSAGTEQMIRADQNDAVQLYFNGNTKLATTNTGVTVSGSIVVSGSLNVGTTGDHADNAAAVTAGLVVGDIYRTGDLIKVVH